MTDDARKVLDEVWQFNVIKDRIDRVFSDGTYEGVLDTRTDPDEPESYARARIAACAPEALRLLMELEDCEQGCPACGLGRDRHYNDCRLVALLVKAGLR